MERIFLGKCGVDSGQLMITDPCYVDKFDNSDYKDIRQYKHKTNGEVLELWKDFQSYDYVHPKYKRTMNILIDQGTFVRLPHPNADDKTYSYQSACMVTQSEKRGGELASGNGVVFASGYGDGSYSVYGYKNKDGRIIKVEVIMGEHMIDSKGEVITDYDETQDDIYLDKKSGRA